MILDGRWKWELQKLSWAISIWRRCLWLSDYAEHQLNRAILYSAVILRKVMEDEEEAESIAKKNQFPLPRQKTIRAELTAAKYPYTAGKGWTARGVSRAANYGEGKTVSVKSKEVCNWLIHSCIWSSTSFSDMKGYSGFLVSSDFDREKYIYFFLFVEWQQLIKLAIEHGTF